MNSSQRNLISALVAVLTGVFVSCASAPRESPERLAGLRYGEECAAARAKARARSAESLTDDDRPKVSKLHILTTPPPASEKGKSIEISMRVDSVGVVMKDGVSFTGISDAKYASLVRFAMAKNLFRPAVLDGCAVEGIARTTMSL